MTSISESTLSALHRVRSSLRSTGRYGSSPFLVGYYGGSGEIAQGFCRAAAVNGGIYILGRKISNIVFDEPEGHDQETAYPYTLELEGFPDPLRASYLVSSPSHLPDQLRPLPIPRDIDELSVTPHQVRAVARCIAIIDGIMYPPCSDESNDIPRGAGESDSFVVVFPPGSLAEGSPVSSVHALTASSGTMSAPSDKSETIYEHWTPG